MLVHLSITEDDIKHGVQGSIGNCPLAIAFKKYTGNERAYVGIMNAISVQTNLVVPLSSEVRRFQRNFDRGNVVELFVWIFDTDDCNMQYQPNLDIPDDLS